MAPLVLAERLEQCRLTLKKGGWKNILSVSSPCACSGNPAPAIAVPSLITGNTSDIIHVSWKQIPVRYPSHSEN